MSITSGNNLSPQASLSTLREQRNSLSNSFERLSSGLRINEPKDDAAGYDLATKLSAESQVLAQAAFNISDGLSLLSIAEEALDSLETVVARQQEIAEAAEDSTIGNTTRTALQEESDLLTDEYNRIINEAEYNGKKIFGSNATSTTIQAGFGGSAQITFSTANISTTSYLDLSSASSSATASTTAESLANTITVQQAAVEGYQTRLEIAFGNLTSIRENYGIATDRITSVDVATEVSKVNKILISQHTSQASLSHSKLDPERALYLLNLD